MTKTIYKFLTKQLILIGLSVLLLCTGLPVIAQDEDNDDKKDSPSMIVLGRKLTKREKDAYLNLERDQKVEALKNDILPREQQLVIVRALLAVGEAEDSKKILEYVYLSEAKTYENLFREFKALKDKHGSVLTGLESTQKYRLSEEEMFKNAANKAYEEVFCTSADSLTTEEQNQLYEFLKQSGASEHGDIVTVLAKSMTEDDKKNLVNKVLEEIDREDLKSNEGFVAKMVAQTFTCKTLRKLFEQLRQ